MDWKQRISRSRWTGVALLAALFVFLVSRFLPELHVQERGFVTGETVAMEGTVVDRGLRRRYSRSEWGTIDFFPHVALADGRTIVLETRVDEHEVPAVGEPIALQCLRDAPRRCRAGGSAHWRNSIGFGAIALIWLLGMGAMAIRILRGPRRRKA